MTDRIAEAAERLARRLETRHPYKSAIQIAVEMIGEPNATVILGQGDYPTARRVADDATALMNEAAVMLRTLTQFDSAGLVDPTTPSQPRVAARSSAPAQLPDRYGATKIQTVQRDFGALRDAIRAHDSFAAEAAWDRCERWIGLWPLVEGDAL